ncbi:F0F1 ATP synthase subunit B [Blattabacterium cuenoti]|uniref:F0F1 ATP synthase subunit B n=1 Tax=Blattabacterium cuenoti TaxID=1653831 RepID=UPI00163B88AF|nr:F0F1 ATP synthase subunit B [Blattabacterium cuenoti]
MDLISPSFGLVFWHFIIFSILILFLSKYAWKPIMDFIEKREKKIRISIDKADKLKVELEQIQIQKNEILKSAYIEKTHLLEEAIRIKKKMENEGLIKKQKIVNSAKKVIAKEKKIAFHQLKNEIGSISIEIAKKILQKKLNKNKKQEELINSILDKFY